MFMLKKIVFMIWIIGVFSFTNSANIFDFPNFSSTTGLMLVGNASLENNKLLLTDTNSTSQAGACWYNKRVNVKNGFETSFQFQIATDPSKVASNCGDGLAFVIYYGTEDSSQIIGSYGEGMGFWQISNGVAVEFDTWRNSGWMDPNSHHVAIQSSDQESPEIRPAHFVGCLAQDTAVPDFKNGEIYTVIISYNGANLIVNLNNTQLLTAPLNWDTILTPAANGKAFIGLTAGTGNATENHYILNWSAKEQAPKILLRQEIKNQNISQYVSLNVFDIHGKKICALINGYKNQGSYNEILNTGLKTKGMFYYQFKSEQASIVKKAVHLNPSSF